MNTFCGRTRREFLWQAGGGFAGAALTAMLLDDGFFAGRARADQGDDDPLAPKPPHFAAKAKSVICLSMYGGVSQVDTWDPKPELTKRNGQPIPNLDKDPLFKARNPGTRTTSGKPSSLSRSARSTVARQRRTAF